MKTLGQIAYERWTGGILRHWFMLEQDERDEWEAAASAVAEECAKACDRQVGLTAGKNIDRGNGHLDCAAAIRSLKTPT